MLFVPNYYELQGPADISLKAAKTKIANYQEVKGAFPCLQSCRMRNPRNIFFSRLLFASYFFAINVLQREMRPE